MTYSSRDSQKSKVYDAERRSGLQRQHGVNTLTIAQCQAMIDRALASKYLADRYPKAFERLRREGITVVATHGGGRAGYDVTEAEDGRRYFGPVIRLGVWARQEIVVWHELAHHIAGLGAGHGWRFTEVQLVLVRRFMGVDAHDALKAAFVVGRVRFRAPRKPRTLTPEQRAVAIANLTAARRTDSPVHRNTWHPADSFDRFTCEVCGRDRVATKFPTTRTRGERECRCRDCRDQHK